MISLNSPELGQLSVLLISHLQRFLLAAVRGMHWELARGCRCVWMRCWGTCGPVEGILGRGVFSISWASFLMESTMWFVGSMSLRCSPRALAAVLPATPKLRVTQHTLDLRMGLKRSGSLWQCPAQLGKTNSNMLSQFLLGRNHRPKRCLMALCCASLG